MKIRQLVLQIVLMVCIFMATTSISKAQSYATLVADRVWVSGNNTLNAEGHVEVLFAETRISATKITYDQNAGVLSIIGPITLTEASGAIILADSAELSDDLRNGVLRSAKLVLDQQLQIAAAEINRVDGRYTQLYKTVASSCRVCAGSPTPLWQIRASRIIHDQQERQLYFDDAVLKVLDVPVFYLPRLRLPDPTLTRATGFLIPQFKSNSKLGFGLKIPYFIKLGDHADLTFAPFIATKTKTLEFQFRRAFRTGNIEFNWAFSKDDVLPGNTRGYLFGEGKFNLPNDFTLNFDIEATTDPDYLSQYGFSEKDRLDSAISIDKTKRNLFFSAELIHYNSLRATENNFTLPTLVGNLTYERRYQPAITGGDITLTLDTHSHYRRSNALGNNGRDLARASLRADWRRDWVLPIGMLVEANLNANVDFYTIHQGLPGEFSGGQFTPSGSVKLSWPFVKNTAHGVSHVIEPVAQVIWTSNNVENIPNEDSRLVEFDEGNLFSLTRFPGADQYDRGLRANVGLRWTRYDPDGWSLGVTVGRVFRADNFALYQPGTGLTGRKSDWLTAVSLKFQNNLSLSNRSVFDDNFVFTKNETRLAWHSDDLGLATSYIWMEAEPFENRLIDTSEWTYSAAYNVTSNWTAKTDGRYDFIAGRAAYVGFGLEFRNECVQIDLSLSRRYTSSTSLTPTTDFGLTVSLTGFGTAGSGRARANSCQ